jgi:IclR family pca regulon transcriptional regulator
VPVVDSRGTTREAMSVAAFTSRATVADLKNRFIPVLRREADRLGRTL